VDNIYVASGATAIVTATLMQVFKNSALVPWISRDTGKLNAIISIAVAGLATIGISYSFDYDQATGAFAIGFSGTTADVLHGVGHWVAQWCSQHAVYKGFIVPAEILGEMRAIQREAFFQQPPQAKPDVPPVGLKP
jgi:hypothetical protein